ncbi:MAG: 2-oxoacid:acceptor oxidoreductase subunit alpha, partial [Methanobrevibacter sp.]|nr:2-oxoacid:acceptor oxidoreductase subunit alpha [Methanobrevibacter sp.]
YRVPVTVLADEVVGHMREKLIIPDDIEIVARKRPEKADGQYMPFDAPCDGTTPMPAFGDGFNIHVTGLTHDERGYPDTNDPDTHTQLVERLCNKVLMHRKDICSVKKENCDDADIVIVSCGSPYRSVGAAMKKGKRRRH